MNSFRRFIICASFVLGVIFLPVSATAQEPQETVPDLSQALHWRNIGPYRGGRTRAVAGVPGQPNVFYIGVCNGGIWKTDDYGRTWTPIFDREPTGSIGSLFVAPSDPNIIYAGSGEGLHRPDLSVGNGIYRTTDGGKTWMHLGLRGGQQIPELAVDPNDPNRVFAAVAGHPYGPNAERGIFRSTDGGQTFQKVLYKDEYTGGDDVLIDPSNQRIVYATMWQAEEGPWENGEWGGPNGGIFKSTDGGSTWQKLTNGLPEDANQAHIAISRSNPQILFASVAVERGVKLYKSENGGESWTVATDDPRPAQRIGGGDLPEPAIDPKNPEVVYMTSIVTWKSTDGGKTWTGFRGAPGGDDYQGIWINPKNPKIILLASDQGAIVTVNGGDRLEFLVQPIHGADVPRQRRQCVSISPMQRPAGKRIRMHREPRERRRDHDPRMASGCGGGIRLRRAGSTRSGYRVWGKVTRYDRRTAKRRTSVPKPFRSGGLSRRAHGADRFLAGESAHFVLRREHPMEDEDGGSIGSRSVRI